MSGLTSSMLIAVNALLVQQSALNATSNNIANANTPGYTREVPIFSESSPQIEGNLVYGSGVSLDQIASMRDRLLQLRLYDETQRQGDAQTQLSALQQIESLFSDNSTGVGADLTAFFNSLNQLSTDPTSIPNRQSVLTAANNLANDIHTTVSQLTSISNNLDLAVSQSVEQINNLIPQIAQLNGQVSSMQKLGIDPGQIQDQRDELIRQLSQIADIAVIQTDQGDTITLSNGTPLVVSGQSFLLQHSPDSTGMEQVYAGGQDITSSIHGGQLGGALQVRDTILPSVFSALDDFATGLATNFNAAHQTGYDLSGNAGGDFFNPVSGAGAAANFSVLISDPAEIAASSDGSPGSNGNLVNLQAVQTQQLTSGQTLLQTYSNLVFAVGNATANAKTASDAADLGMQQVTDQWNAVSGVSIDEEAANLIRFQHAFAAAARVITTVDEMTQVILSMGSPLG